MRRPLRNLAQPVLILTLLTTCGGNDSPNDRIWQITAIDTSEGISFLKAETSIAVDSKNKVHVCYVSRAGLKYATNALGVWTTQVLDTAGSKPSIAIDSKDAVHISYHSYPYYGPAYVGVKYATNSSGSWTVQQLAATTSLETGTPSIAVGPADFLHISFANNDYSSTTLGYATNVSGTWSSANLYPTGEASILKTSISVDLNDKVHIAYIVETAGTGSALTVHSLYYRTNESGSWITTYIARARDTALSVDKNNLKHLSYFKTSPTYPCDTLVHATNDAGAWSSEDVVSLPSCVGFGLSTAEAIDSANKVHIVYGAYNDSRTITNISYTTNMDGSWKIYAVSDVAENGLYPSIAVDSSRRQHILYFDVDYRVFKYAVKL